MSSFRSGRALEVGPDYEGIKMTRRILDSARGVIVHSQFMVDEMRGSGFSGPWPGFRMAAGFPKPTALMANETWLTAPLR